MSLDGSNNPEGEEAMTTAVSFSSAEDSNNSKQSKRPRLTVNQEENDNNDNNNDNSHNGNEDKEASTDPTLERKRLRDRQRRAEYAKSFEDLLSLLIDLDPDVRSMLERENNLVGMGHM